MDIRQLWFDKKARKWMWIVLLTFGALQLYYVQAMLAALFLFTVVFAVFAVLALVLYGFDRAAQWSFGWAGQHTRVTIAAAGRGWRLPEEASKKQLRRLRSELAQ